MAGSYIDGEDLNMKAYGVTNQHGFGNIVYAPDSATAKRWGMKYNGGAFDHDEFTDIRCYRIPLIDGKQTHEGVVPWETKEGQLIYWQAGWWPEEGATSCENCGHYPFDLIPESQLDEDCICAECNTENDGSEARDERR